MQISMYNSDYNILFLPTLDHATIYFWTNNLKPMQETGQDQIPSNSKSS